MYSQSVIHTTQWMSTAIQMYLDLWYTYNKKDISINKVYVVYRIIPSTAIIMNQWATKISKAIYMSSWIHPLSTGYRITICFTVNLHQQPYITVIYSHSCKIILAQLHKQVVVREPIWTQKAATSAAELDQNGCLIAQYSIVHLILFRWPVGST